MDQTLLLFSDPYRYISRKCRKLDTDIFETTIFLKKTICLTGKEAAEEVFYNNELIKRHGASPGILKATLLGKGGVQDMDGDAHKHRKAMFMSIMSSENIHGLGKIVTDVWESYLPKWIASDKIVFYDELHLILTEAVCQWAGVRLRPEEVQEKSKELTALFDAAGSKNIFRHFYSRYSRKKLDRWAEGIIHEIRKNSTQIITPAQIIALHHDLKGRLLDEPTAAVELLNILRPVVAVSVYMTFIAHALNLHPESKLRLEHHEVDYTEWFVNEVRRLYPFFPTAIGKARKTFQWRGHNVKKGTQVLFDIHGTNNDPRAWDNPKEFFPERFKKTIMTPYNFLPQGGGTHSDHHRCPGEFITVELMKVAVDFLVKRIEYTVPEQNLKIDFRRTPAIPTDKFIMANVRENYPIDKVNIPTEKIERELYPN